MQYRKNVQFIFVQLQLKSIPLMHNAKIIQNLMIQDQALISSQNAATDDNEIKGKEVIKWKKIGDKALDEKSAKQVE